MSFELRLAQIMYVESMNHKLIIHHDNGDFIERKNLSSFIKEIDSNNFIQIHKSFVINKTYLLLLNQSKRIDFKRFYNSTNW